MSMGTGPRGLITRGLQLTLINARNIIERDHPEQIANGLICSSCGAMGRGSVANHESHCAARQTLQDLDEAIRLLEENWAP